MVQGTIGPGRLVGGEKWSRVPGGALAQNHPPGSTKFPRFRGLFLSLSTPECFLEKGYYLGSCWSGKGTESVSNRYNSGKGIVLSGTEC